MVSFSTLSLPVLRVEIDCEYLKLSHFRAAGRWKELLRSHEHINRFDNLSLVIDQQLHAFLQGIGTLLQCDLQMLLPLVQRDQLLVVSDTHMQ